jgi:hypothetical protein
MLQIVHRPQNMSSELACKTSSVLCCVWFAYGGPWKYICLLKLSLLWWDNIISIHTSTPFT